MGADFGSDSVRVVILDAADGNILGASVAEYPRWKQGLFCNPAKNQFRQSPKDYIESLSEAVKAAVAQSVLVDPDAPGKVVSFSIDTTGSTVAPAYANGHVLAEMEEFSEDPDGMFILWKDHTAVEEAKEINTVSKTWGGVDYTSYSGGVYSAEWFWAKLLHVVRDNEAVRNATASAVEHCDWMAGLLTNTLNPLLLKRSRCTAGHKCMYNKLWGGYPSEEFLNCLDPVLGEIRRTLPEETYSSTEIAGMLSKKWLETFNLTGPVLVTVGALDAHIGAIGGGLRPGVMVKSIGTSTCDILIGDETPAPVAGICGQVDGSVIEGFTGYEAGQSAYGDLYAWFRNLLMWPILQDDAISQETAEKIEKQLLARLEQQASAIPTDINSPVALDWINGRRTPFANQYLTCAMQGITLGTSAPQLMKTLLEATAFGARAILECIEAGGVAVTKIVAIGGVARKSKLGMQILADITGREICVTAGDQSPAIGAAICASVAAGLYHDVFEAQDVLCAGIERTHVPNPLMKEIYDCLYKQYLELGKLEEAR